MIAKMTRPLVQRRKTFAVAWLLAVFSMARDHYLCLLLLVRLTQAGGQVDDLPPLLDADDIAYFFAKRDIDSLHWALQTVFERSQRNPNLATTGNSAQPLLEQLVARGGGSTYTSAYKLQHDLEQAEYLAEKLQNTDPEAANFFQKVVAPTYRDLIDRIPPLDKLTRTQGLYAFSAADQQTTLVNQIYNKALHRTNLDELLDSEGNKIPMINPSLDTVAAERQWFGKDDYGEALSPSDGEEQPPGIIVLDNLLSEEALAALQRIMWESTVWYQTKMPLKFGGYVGAYIDDGLHDRILLQLAVELAEGLPRILEDHPLKYLWAYKYDSEYNGINLHSDQAAINVNFWLTPEEANLDPKSGGLVVFTAKPPADWDFASYNTDTGNLVREQLLRPTGFANVTVPYQCNRAVIFDSALFHQTDKFQFRKGYTNRRINLTLLYGDMQLKQSAASEQTATASKEEL